MKLMVSDGKGNWTEVKESRISIRADRIIVTLSSSPHRAGAMLAAKTVFQDKADFIHVHLCDRHMAVLGYIGPHQVFSWKIEGVMEVWWGKNNVVVAGDGWQATIWSKEQQRIVWG